MKRIFLFLSTLLFISTVTQAKGQLWDDLSQSINLGTPINWGLRCSNGLELSHQRALEVDKQLEFNVGLSSNHRRKDYDLTLVGAYQWVYPLSDVDQVEWFTGTNLQCGYYDLRTDASFNMGLGGQLGIEYSGSAPVQFTLDLRPVYYMFYGRSLELNVGLGVRYFL